MKTLDKHPRLLLFVYTIVMLALGAFLMHTHMTALKPLPKGPPDIICYEMPQSDLRGWKRVPEVDKHRIADAVRRGKPQWREEESLKCYPYAENETPWVFVAKEQWVRAK